MIIKITDIPPEGRELDFPLSHQLLNQRINSVADVYDKNAVKPPEYVFEQSPSAHVELQLQGSTVFLEGTAKGAFTSPCSRCGNSVRKEVTTPLKIVLKPRPENPADWEEEDVEFGYYADKEVNCATIVEDIVVLELPYAVYCSEVGEDCVLPEISKEDSKTAPFADERFAVLKNIKIN